MKAINPHGGRSIQQRLLVPIVIALPVAIMGCDGSSDDDTSPTEATEMVEPTAVETDADEAGKDGERIYLNYRNITVAAGENSMGALNNTVSLDNVIDAESADALEIHTQESHVWHTGEQLELLFDFQADYLVTTVHFWNYFDETYDVDTLDLAFQDATGRETGTLVVTPESSSGDPIGSQDILLDPPVSARFVTAVIRGDNSQSDFQNIGFSAQPALAR